MDGLLPDNVFELWLDHAQTRIAHDRLAATICGLHESESDSNEPLHGWDPWYQTFSGDEAQTWVSPVCGTLMLKPIPLTAAWNQSASGATARLLKADFTFNDSSKWVETNKNGNAATFVSLKDSAAGDTDRRLATTASMPENQAMYLNVFAHVWGSERTIIAEFGWAASSTAGTGVAGILYSDGSVEIFKDSVLVKNGSINAKKGENQTDSAGRFVKLLLIPYRETDLLVYSNQGGGFTVTFEDLPVGATGNTITDATKFWFYFPNGKAEFELAKLTYVSSGYRSSLVWHFNKPPASGSVAEFSSSHSGTASFEFVSYADGSTSFVPNGIENRGRVRCDMTGDTNTTPFVYWAHGEYPTETGLTNSDEQYNVYDDFLLAWSLRIGSHPAEDSLDFVCFDPDAMEDAGIDRPGSLSNRPIRLVRDGLTLFEGISDRPQVDEADRSETTRINYRARSRWKSFERYQFRARTPLDGLSTLDRFGLVLGAMGCPSSDVEDFPGAPVTIEGAGSRNDFQDVIAVGDSGAQVIDQLHESLCSHAVMAFLPDDAETVFTVKALDSLSPVSEATVYLTVDDAILDGAAADFADRACYERVCSRWTEAAGEPLANEVHVEGLDRKRQRPIVRTYTDRPSQDITLPPSARPDNWIGEPALYGLRSRALGDTASVENAARLLGDRETQIDEPAEYSGAMIVSELTGLPVWKGSRITVYGKGDYYVDGLTLTGVKTCTDSDDFWTIDATYQLQKVRDDGSAQGVKLLIGDDLESMREYATAMQESAKSKFKASLPSFERIAASSESVN